MQAALAVEGIEMHIAGRSGPPHAGGPCAAGGAGRKADDRPSDVAAGGGALVAPAAPGAGGSTTTATCTAWPMTGSSARGRRRGEDQLAHALRRRAATTRTRRAVSQMPRSRRASRGSTSARRWRSGSTRARRWRGGHTVSAACNPVARQASELWTSSSVYPIRSLPQRRESDDGARAREDRCEQPEPAEVVVRRDGDEREQHLLASWAAIR